MKDCFQIAIKNLISRRLRSYLTILGILIGVFLIVTLLSLSEGLKEAIFAQLRMYGTNVLYIFPGSFEDLSSILGMFMGRFEIENETLEKIKKIEGIENVIPFDYRAELVRYEKKVKTVLLFSYPRESGQEIFKNEVGWKLIAGTWPKPGKREVLVGKLVPVDIFPGLAPGDKIYIKGKEFLVTGILQSLGSKQDDSMIEVDLEHFKQITGLKGGSPFALVKTKPNTNQELLATKIKEVLKENQKRKVGKEELEFTVLTNEKVGSIASSILLIIQV
ncbi:ABC transporter permease, partial [Candidatus Parcubacteria bacterium]|nr:ABC transporter permease [Candidatus Parcubacteria bacterium]